MILPPWLPKKIITRKRYAIFEGIPWVRFPIWICYLNPDLPLRGLDVEDEFFTVDEEQPSRKRSWTTLRFKIGKSIEP